MLRKLEVTYVPLGRFILRKTRHLDVIMQKTGEVWAFRAHALPLILARVMWDLNLFAEKSEWPELENDSSPTHLMGAQICEFKQEKEEPERAASNER